ncbi:MAG: hypothetical protein JKY95_03295 [Planctomycetaceae bacterium]|nr:hypothetical protein [Planctomycetaceae bacterium]
MLDSLLQQTTIPILEKVTSFGQRRHQVLVGNIANIDTPGYEMRDLPVQDFERALQQAILARRENISSGTASAQSQLLPQELLTGMQQSPFSSTPGGIEGGTGGQMRNLADYFSRELNVAHDASSKNVTFHDGGNRSIEQESMEMVKNTGMQSFAIQVMISQMNMLETVISERVV